jgi:hypothetical protein
VGETTLFWQMVPACPEISYGLMSALVDAFVIDYFDGAIEDTRVAAACAVATSETRLAKSKGYTCGKRGFGLAF